ncbi:MAG TPA: phosphoglucosamine mutase [Acidimicrobiales bacterium]|nr:phosphoglucosamine mutase [Acidimicrobiales bacterium]
MPRPGFGTDGVRGVANSELTAELAVALGRAAATVLGARAFVVGRDTRQSGTMLQAALSAGMASGGADVVDLGVLPTAGVAFVGERRGVPAAMVSASHNPYRDNGIKFFDAAGVKLTPDVEAQIEDELDLAPGDRGMPARVGTLGADPGAVGEYRRHLVESLEGRRLDGLHVVVDCANGAASQIAPEVLGSLGASVEALCTDPDGTNINDACGSTDPGRLADVVVQRGADLGLALDGDADRLVAVDHTGAVCDGDVLLAIFAIDLESRGLLAGDAVVVTVMTNLGFRLAMAERGISVHETPVGDRHVLAALDDAGLALGGEQSGHIVFRARASTGDGVLTGLLLADAVVRAGRPLAALADGLVERVPQVLLNVEVPDPGRLAAADGVWKAVAEVEAELGASGRVLLRASGTEPLVRVMVEARTQEAAAGAAGRLSEVVQAILGG